MSLPNYLANIKSSGIYRFVWDKSVITATEAETLRLVVGYSEKGRFNTPVYCATANDFITEFGNINKKLERSGVFFHRMALQALASGPIIALNLKKLKGEQVVSKAYYPKDKATFTETTVSVSSVYDTSRFWTLEPSTLMEKATVDAEKTAWFAVSSVDTEDASCSFFIRSYVPAGYDITVKEWCALYNNGSKFENAMVNLQDFFAEVYVFKGQFTKEIATSDALSRYFDVDASGNVSIKKSAKNVFGEDVDVLDALADNEYSGFIGKYRGCLIPNFKGADGSYISLDLIFNSDVNKHKLMMYIDEDNMDDDLVALDETLVSSGLSYTTDDLTKLIEANSTTSGSMPSVFSNYTASTMGYYEAMPYVYIKGVETQLAVDTDILCLNASSETSYAQIVGSSIVFGDAQPSQKFKPTDYKYIYAVGSAGHSIVRGTIESYNEKTYTITTTNVIDCETGEVLPDDLNNFTCGFPADSTIQQLENEKYIIISKYDLGSRGLGYSIYTPLYLKGFTKESIKTDGTVEGKLKLQKDLLSPLSMDSSTGYPGLVEALTNRKDIDYRYIVDTFESFIETECKSILSLLAKKKDNCLLLTNFPAIKTFIKSKTVSFLDENGAFQMSNVKDSSKFSLPSEENGASWCSFNTPVILSDGTVKTTCPAASLVSNRYMDKYSSRLPYYIVAGPTYGKLTADGLVGPDYNFSRADLDILEPMGVNATVYVPRKGVYISSNQTAKQNPVSALSKINVRELVIYLQDQIEDLLQNYQWEFNTASLRELIKTKADYILDNVQANNGVYQYYNQCDELNNTDEVINNEMLVLSTSIEPGLGAGKMVQELTIYKKGGMSSVITNG
jgi:hypothetical protein